MGKKGNALMVFLVLILDALMCGVWYVTLFPVEPASTLDTVGSTILAIFGTAVGLVLTYVMYDSCISEEES